MRRSNRPRNRPDAEAIASWIADPKGCPDADAIARYVETDPIGRREAELARAFLDPATAPPSSPELVDEVAARARARASLATRANAGVPSAVGGPASDRDRGAGPRRGAKPGTPRRRDPWIAIAGGLAAAAAVWLVTPWIFGPAGSRSAADPAASFGSGTFEPGSGVWRGGFQVFEPTGRLDAPPARVRFGEVEGADAYHVEIWRIEGSGRGPGRIFEVAEPVVVLDDVADFLSAGEFGIRIRALSAGESIRSASANFHVPFRNADRDRGGAPSSGGGPDHSKESRP